MTVYELIYVYDSAVDGADVSTELLTSLKEVELRKKQFILSNEEVGFARTNYSPSIDPSNEDIVDNVIYEDACDVSSLLIKKYNI